MMLYLTYLIYGLFSPFSDPYHINYIQYTLFFYSTGVRL